MVGVCVKLRCNLEKLAFFTKPWLHDKRFLDVCLIIAVSWFKYGEKHCKAHTYVRAVDNKTDEYDCPSSEIFHWKSIHGNCECNVMFWTLFRSWNHYLRRFFSKGQISMLCTPWRRLWKPIVSGLMLSTTTLSLKYCCQNNLWVFDDESKLCPLICVCWR